MMGRSADWSPLAASDPVPGDPAGISAEAAHLSSVAEQIAGQVAVLRKIASGHSDEKGQYAVKLQSAASDTAGRLAKVTGRYRETAAALTAWVPELEYAQAQSLKALSQAQEAQGRQRASQPIQRPPGTHLTPADQQEDQARSNALSQANTDMAAAQAMLTAAVSHRDTAAAQAASKILSAISADADSWLDGVTGFFSSAWGWVKDHWVPLLKDLCTGLEILATLLAIACLFIPGLDIVDVLLLIAFGATVLAALGRGALAVTGNGSWLDFGLDVIACLTFGLSEWVFSPALANAAKGAMETGEDLVAGERASAADEYMTKFFGNALGRLIGEGKATELATQWATEDIPGLAVDSEKAGYFTRFADALKAGGKLEDYENFSKLSTVYARYGSSPDVIAAMAKGGRVLTGLRVASAFSWGGAISGLVGGGGEMDSAHGDPVFRVPIPGISSGWDWAEHWFTHPLLPGFSMASGGGG
jgi:hypothetical protein